MVLMLTAANAPGDRVSVLTLGADDYLAKHFPFPELIRRIPLLRASPGFLSAGTLPEQVW